MSDHEQLHATHCSQKHCVATLKPMKPIFLVLVPAPRFAYSPPSQKVCMLCNSLPWPIRHDNCSEHNMTCVSKTDMCISGRVDETWCWISDLGSYVQYVENWWEARPDKRCKSSRSCRCGPNNVSRQGTSLCNSSATRGADVILRSVAVILPFRIPSTKMFVSWSWTALSPTALGTTN